jgi:hypothetical protein
VRRSIPVAASPETLAKMRAPAPIRFYRRFTWGSAPPLRSSIAPFESDRLRLVAAPGHCADHHVVWDESDGTLFGGDLYLGVKVRIAHPGEDPRLLAKTLRRVAALGPTRLFDAHRGFVRNPAPLLEAKADWTEEDDRGDRTTHPGWRPTRRSSVSCLGRVDADTSPVATTLGQTSSGCTARNGGGIAGRAAATKAAISHQPSAISLTLTAFRLPSPASRLPLSRLPPFPASRFPLPASRFPLPASRQFA